MRKGGKRESMLESPSFATHAVLLLAVTFVGSTPTGATGHPLTSVDRPVDEYQSLSRTDALTVYARSNRAGN
jgi:hypothetical protein